MEDILSKFVSNYKKSIEIGFIRYSLYSLSVLIIPIILAIMPWIGFIFSFVAGSSTLMLGSMIGILISVVMFIGILFLSFYTENCAWKAYIHTLKTGEKLSYGEYFRNGTKGYWRFVGKVIAGLLLPMIIVMILASVAYIIPFIGSTLEYLIITLGTIYLTYGLYGRLLGISCNDFKAQINNYVVIIIISTILNLLGLYMIDVIVISFITPITLITLLSKSDINNMID